MICPYCHQEHPDNARFCPTTGQAFPTFSTACPSCGRPVKPGTRFCPTCGGLLSPAPPNRRSINRTGLYGSILVFGLAGILTGVFLLARSSLPKIAPGFPTTGLTTAVITPAQTQGQESLPVVEPTNSQPDSTEEVVSESPVFTAAPSTPANPIYTAAAQTVIAQLTQVSTPATSIPFERLPLQGDKLAQMTFGQNTNYNPCLSQDQRKLAYISKIAGHWQVIEDEPNGLGSPRQITAGQADYFHPCWSADGSQLLVTSDKNGSLDIYIINAGNGGVVEQLTNDPGDDQTPVWLPDHSGFVFASQRDGDDEIYLVRFDGTTPKRLTHSPGFDGFPSVSPDGQRIAFYSARDGNYEIYTMALDGGSLDRLTDHSARDADPVYSPDGDWIVFESNRAGEYDLYAVRVDGSNLRSILSDRGNDYGPVFSPDGRWLLFQSDRDGEMNLYRQPWVEGSGEGTENAGEISSEGIKPNSKDGAILIYIPAGDFTMGSSRESDPGFYGSEGPPHQIYLDAYWIYQTEVTNSMYSVCVEQKSCPKPADMDSNTRKGYYEDSDYGNYPVVNVSWKNASAYCKWAGGRLPTEAEWEKAGRGTDGRLYPWGNEAPSPERANYGTNDTQPTGSYPAGASPYGVLDLAGNVIEWVFDWFQPTFYSVSPEQNPLGPETGTTRVYRGGAYHNLDSALRVVMRGSRRPDHSNVDIGFRCAMDDQ